MRLRSRIASPGRLLPMAGRVVIVSACVAALVACTSAVPDAASPPPDAPAGQVAPSGNTTPTDPTTLAPDAYAAELFADTNAVRDEQGLEPFVHNDCAQRQALLRAEALVGKPELAHADGAAVYKACPGWNEFAENLSRSNAAPQRVVGAWMDSPGHASNILDPNLAQLGIGCVPNPSTGELICSQVFLGNE